MSVNSTIWAKHALTASGWQNGVCVEVDNHGVICAVQSDQTPRGEQVDILLPAMCNLHSHAFQRAMAGMTETRGKNSQDSFWTWRQLMYRFLEHISPQDAEVIAAFGQMEMLESGYTSVGEFHYLHHQSNGKPYTNSAEMSERIVAASVLSGIGLTLLPVMYEQGGCDGRALGDGQKRFGNIFDTFSELYLRAADCINHLAPNGNIGVAPHSLRAVSPQTLDHLIELANGAPVHIHIAEQQAEVDELLASYHQTPVAWLIDNQPVNSRWCLIHATHMTLKETEKLAASGAVAGLCPITESNLGDGIFNGLQYKNRHGAFGIGTDSNVRISLAEELRTLEYSQRLKEQARAVYADSHRSTGRVLYEAALSGGAQALQRETGRIERGCKADLLSLNGHSIHLMPVTEDGWLDAWLFAADDSLVSEVWAGGVRVVKEGRHINRESIEARYRQTLTRLMSI